jgi:hypothetical protein
VLEQKSRFVSVKKERAYIIQLSSLFALLTAFESILLTYLSVWQFTTAVSVSAIYSNDTSNHVPSCGRMNSSKGSAGPSDFLRRSDDGKGLEYEIVGFCEYVQKYYAVKVKYG